MAFGKSQNSDTNWMSFSDIMTGLMVIFMFIAISYIVEVQEKQKHEMSTFNELKRTKEKLDSLNQELREEKKQRDNIFEEFKATKDTLYAELKKEFEDDFEQWDVELDRDLSIKFTNPEVLFKSGSSEINSHFAEILDEFLPRYIGILLKPKYKDKISEIRIEGHTDRVPVSSSDMPYIGNLILSQQRSSAVMKYFIRSTYYKSLNDDLRAWLLFHFTSNGLSYGRTLDDNEDFTFVTKEPVNDELSRRVEFRIMTTSEALVEKVLEQIKE